MARDVIDQLRAWGEHYDDVVRPISVAEINASRTGDEPTDPSPSTSGPSPVIEMQPNHAHRPSAAGRVLAISAALLIAAGLAGVVRNTRSTPTSSDGVATVPIVDNPATTNGVIDPGLLAPGELRALPPAPIAGRTDPAEIWTGTVMLIWGGSTTDTTTGGEVPFADGATYDPTTNTWNVLPPAPLAGRSNPATVWTGTEAVIWGGSDNGTSMTDGAAYDPATRTWRQIPTYPMVHTVRPTTVWTGTEMIVLDGINGSAAGAAFNPTTNTWRTIAPPPAHGAMPYPQAVWTGRVVVAELYDSSSNRHSLATYDPTTDTWQALTTDITDTDQLAHLVWTGTEILLLGRNPGAAWNPTTGTWRRLAAPATLPPILGTPSAVWTGHLVAFWTGGPTATLYDPATDTWHDIDAGHLSPRVDVPLVTGNGLVLSWSGFQTTTPDHTSVADGIIWRPTLPTTTTPDTTPAPRPTASMQTTAAPPGTALPDASTPTTPTARPADDPSESATSSLEHPPVGRTPRIGGSPCPTRNGRRVARRSTRQNSRLMRSRWCSTRNARSLTWPARSA